MHTSKYYVAMVAILGTQISMAEKLDPLVIESNIFNNHPNSSYSAPIKVLNKDDIRDKNTTSLGEVVNYEPGMSSSHFAPGASRPIIRGQNNHRILLMENGADVSDVSEISADHAVSVETLNAERIEILRGPATLRYGPGAVGGVINVINHRIPQTISEQPFNLDLQLEHATGSNAETVAIELNGSVENFSWHFDALSRETEDYDIKGYADEDDRENKGTLENSDMDTENYALGGSFISDDYIIGFSYSKLDSDYGLPGGHGHEEEDHVGDEDEDHVGDEDDEDHHHEESSDMRIDMKQQRYDAHLEWLSPFNNIESILLRSTVTDYEHDEVTVDGDVEVTFDNESWDTRLELVQHASDHMHNAFGLQYVDKDFSAIGEEAFIEAIDEERLGIFAITKNTYDQWTMELGARYDFTDYDAETLRDKDFSTYSLSLGAVNYFSDNTEISFSAGISQRAPHNIALYSKGAHHATETYETGDVNIDEETSYSFDIGIHQQRQNFDWQLNAFYNHIDNYIYLANTDLNADGIADMGHVHDGEFEIEEDGELLNGIYDNEDAYFYGFEAQMNTNLYQTTSTQLDGRVFVDYVRAKFSDGVGNVPRITPARLGVTLSANHNQWNAALDNIFVSEQNKAARLESSTDSYMMVNARLSRTLHIDNTDVKLFVRADNLLDDDARQHTSIQKETVPLPGRNINIGLSFRY